jgi:predicted phage baseplate assembly protein
MSASSCGCSTQPCGCCEGIEVQTPPSTENRPGLPQLTYRVGTHGSFMQTMLARLSTMEVEVTDLNGQPLPSVRPLTSLSTRDTRDFSIALLDGWATVGDVLTFYDERIANEGFLRTATERRSVLELARLVGYTLRPGVAATVYLAYTLDENQTGATTIAAGTRAQSIPGPGETPQSFETSDDLVARPEWNSLNIRQTRPQNIVMGGGGPNDATLVSLLTVEPVGSAPRPGDKLLMLFDDKGQQFVARTVASVDTQSAAPRRAIHLQPYEAPQAAGAGPEVTSASEFIAPLLIPPVLQPANSLKLVRGLQQAFLSQPVTAGKIADAARVRSAAAAPASATGTPTGTSRATLASTPPNASRGDALARASVAAGAGASRGSQSPVGRQFSDAGTQLLVNFIPNLADSYYAAWAGARLNPAPAPLKALHVLRARTTLFGASSPKPPSFYYYTADDGSHVQPGTLKSPSLWGGDWPYESDEKDSNAYLDQANESIVPGSFALAITPAKDGGWTQQTLRISQVTANPRSAYGISGPSTELLFDAPATWRKLDGKDDITDLRKTQLYAQSEPLTLADEPVVDAVSGGQLELGALYKELTSGRWIILSGERADIDEVDGVQASELLMISGLSQGFDATLPGDLLHTTLTLATDTAYAYKRDTLTIFANVVKATHGETRNEILGSGDGTQNQQTFTLKQPPLTFVAAPTMAGADSTLKVYVDNVEWHESESPAWLGARDRGFVTLTGDDGATSVIFGNGTSGMRVPTGVQNVQATYRNGIGAPGNVRAQQVSLLQTRPLGVKAVINPLRASGGADRESRDLARENVPLSVMPLDRLVSVQDYADFTRRFAGIGKAVATAASVDGSDGVFLTIAGVDDAPVDPVSDLYRNLLDALHVLGDPDLPLWLDVRELKVLVLSAGIHLLPDYKWETVAAAVRALLLDAFGFGHRALGQAALRSEIIAAIQGVAGVDYVDVDAFGAVPEKVADDVLQTRRLVTQEDVADAINLAINPAAGSSSTGKRAAHPRQTQRVDAWPGGADHGVLRPAELVIFTPAVTDTLILNQIP